MKSKTMFNKVIQFINKLQESDDVTKKRWLVIFATPTALIIIIGWVFALRANLTLETAVVEKESNFRQFAEVFKRGAMAVGGRIAEGSRYLMSALNEQLRYFKEIGPQELKFTPDNMEPIKPKRYVKP
jgi:hypothetical protein